MTTSSGINNFGGAGTPVDTKGVLNTTPLIGTTVYTLTCKNGNSSGTGYNSVSKEVSVTVSSATAVVPTISLTANGSSIANGGTVTATNGTVALVWGGTGATSCTLNGNSVPTSGSQTFSGLTSSASYTYTCTNSYGSRSLSFSVSVPTASKPSAWLYLPGSAAADGTLSVSWSGNNSPTSYRLKINGVEKDMGTATSWSGPVASLGLGAGTHTFYVQACNSAGCGNWDGPYFLTIQGPVAFNPNSATFVLGASAACVDFPVNMHRGYESYGVTRLQEFLKSKNFLGEVTGFYGDKTVAAVREYQATKNLPVTGMTYDFTRQMIKADSCQ